MVNVTLLDFAGLALAVVFAVVVAFFGHASFLPLMLIFLAASVLVTKYGYGEKRETLDFKGGITLNDVDYVVFYEKQNFVTSANGAGHRGHENAIKRITVTNAR